MTTVSHESGRDAMNTLRRRGDVLRQAILAAALDQLNAVGWKRLTMEGVAACAHTGKAALYRRWASKHELIVAALESALPVVREAPDLGSLRADLVYMLDRTRVVMSSPAGCALKTIMEEFAHEPDEVRAFQAVIREKVLEPGRRVTTAVLRRGVDRGEVRPDADFALLSDVGPAMMLYRSKISDSEIEPDYPARVVDEVLLPMLRPVSSSAAGTPA